MKLPKAKSDFLSIPNLLSYFRILLLPFLLYFQSKERTQHTVLWSGIIIILSGISDFLDGYIARKYDQVTEIGKFIDPLADKLTQLTLVICLAMNYPFIYFLLGLFILKELYTLVFSLILLRKGVKMDGAKWYGKLSTTVFYISFIGIFLFPSMPQKLMNALIIISAFFMGLAFLLYSRLLFHMWEQSREYENRSIKSLPDLLTKEQGLPVDQNLIDPEKRRTPKKRHSDNLKKKFSISDEAKKNPRINNKTFILQAPSRQRSGHANVRIYKTKVRPSQVQDYIQSIKNHH